MSNTSRLEAAHIRISRDGRGRALDNIFVERYWQSVKYEEVYLKGYDTVPMAVQNWNRSELTKLLDARFSELVRHRYTNQLVTHIDLLPKSIGIKKESTINYMLDRTLLRPRDVITFFNCCVSNAEDEPKIKVEQLLNAESQYSHLRMRSLADEWSIHYPYLISICNLLKKRTPSFKLKEFEDEDLVELCVDVISSEPTSTSEYVERIHTYYHSSNKNKAKILRA